MAAEVSRSIKVFQILWPPWNWENTKNTELGALGRWADALGRWVAGGWALCGGGVDGMDVRRAGAVKDVDFTW